MKGKAMATYARKMKAPATGIPSRLYAVLSRHETHIGYALVTRTTGGYMVTMVIWEDYATDAAYYYRLQASNTTPDTLDGFLTYYRGPTSRSVSFPLPEEEAPADKERHPGLL